jgi:steroid delta-isomerase-like uncharacterized protein
MTTQIKRWALVALAAAAVAGFSLGSWLVPAPVVAGAAGPKEVTTAYLAAWNAKDADAAAALMSDDVEYLDVTVGEAQKGRDAARDNVIKVFFAAVPDLKWEMKGEPIVAEDGIAFEWTFSGTNTGAWGPETPATGKTFSFDGVTFIRVKDGKIAYQGDYYDGYGFQKQLGWIE